MVRVYYDRGGVTVSDFEIEEFVDQLIGIIEQNKRTTYGYKLVVSTEAVILAIRVAIRSGRIKCNEIEVYNGLKGEPITYDEYGKPDSKCKAIPSVVINYRSILLGWLD